MNTWGRDCNYQPRDKTKIFQETQNEEQSGKYGGIILAHLHQLLEQGDPIPAQVPVGIHTKRGESWKAWPGGTQSNNLTPEYLRYEVHTLTQLCPSTFALQPRIPNLLPKALSSSRGGGISVQKPSMKQTHQLPPQSPLLCLIFTKSAVLPFGGVTRGSQSPPAPKQCQVFFISEYFPPKSACACGICCLTGAVLVVPKLTHSRTINTSEEEGEAN